jgi:hypothetical protein
MAASPSSHLHIRGLSVVVSRRSWLRAPVSARSVHGIIRLSVESVRIAFGLFAPPPLSSRPPPSRGAS